MIEVKGTDLAYTAGLLDGEGTISIQVFNYTRYAPRKKKKGQGVYGRKTPTGFELRISIDNTYLPLGIWLKERFGGIVYIHKGNRLPLFRWILKSEKARIFLLSVFPYLTIKKTQAEVAIAFQEVKNKRIGKSFTSDQRESLMRFAKVLPIVRKENYIKKEIQNA